VCLIGQGRNLSNRPKSAPASLVSPVVGSIPTVPANAAPTKSPQSLDRIAAWESRHVNSVTPEANSSAAQTALDDAYFEAAMDSA
jgi:hypothetical protein